MYINVCVCVCVCTRDLAKKEMVTQQWVSKATIDSEVSSLWKPVTESADPGAAAGGAITPLTGRDGRGKEKGYGESRRWGRQSRGPLLPLLLLVTR